jgi:hypothetical protein
VVAVSGVADLAVVGVSGEVAASGFPGVIAESGIAPTSDDVVVSGVGGSDASDRWIVSSLIAASLLESTVLRLGIPA